MNALTLSSGFLSIISVFVDSVIPFMVARFVNGMMCGLYSVTAPVYLNEIAPREIRG